MKAPRKREPNAKPVVLQERDNQLFLLIYLCDGLMSEKQLIRCCFDCHPKNASSRLLALFDNRYLNRNWKEKQWRKFPQLVYSLDELGYLVVEELLGHEVKRNNKLVSSSSPNSSWPHHFDVIDIRLKVMEDVGREPELNLGHWFSDGFFRSGKWRVKVPLQNDVGKVEQKAYQPDGFFPIWRWIDEAAEKRQFFGFILEVDRGSEPQTTKSLRFTTIYNKLRAGKALLESPAYREEFGLKNGRCLMITDSWPRAENMMRLAREVGAGWAWYFTIFEQATSSKHNILADPIWRSATQDQPTSIVPPSK